MTLTPTTGDADEISRYAGRMSRLIDLSHVIEAGMTTYPGLPGPEITEHLTRDDSRTHYETGTEFHIGRIDMVANTGTYLDTLERARGRTAQYDTSDAVQHRRHRRQTT